MLENLYNLGAGGYNYKYGWWKIQVAISTHSCTSWCNENRRFVARSANTGISSVIDCFGNVVSAGLGYVWCY